MGKCTATLRIGGELSPSQYSGLMGVCSKDVDFMEDTHLQHTDMEYFTFYDDDNWSDGFPDIEVYCASVRIPYVLTITNRDDGADTKVIYNPFSRAVELHGLRSTVSYTLMNGEPIWGFNEISYALSTDDFMYFRVLESHYEEGIPELKIPHLREPATE